MIIFIVLSFFVVFCRACDTQQYHAALWANYCSLKGDHQQARQRMAPLVRPLRSPALYRCYAMMLKEEGCSEFLSYLAPEFDMYAKDDIAVQGIVAQAKERVGKLEDALVRYQELAQKKNLSCELLYQVAHFFIRHQRPEEACALLAPVVAQQHFVPMRFVFQLLLAQAHEQLKQPERALAYVVPVLMNKPRSGHAWVLWSLLHDTLGHKEHALKGYALAASFVSSSCAEKILPTTSTDQNLAAFYAAVRTLLKKGLYNQAYAQARCLYEQEHDLDAALLVLELLHADNQQDAFWKFIFEAYAHNNHDAFAMMAHRLYHLSEHAAPARNFFEKAVRQWPNNQRLYLYAFDLSLRDSDLDRCLELLSMSVVQTSYHYQQCLVYAAALAAHMRCTHSLQKIEEYYATTRLHNRELEALLAQYYATDGQDTQKARHYLLHSITREHLRV